MGDSYTFCCHMLLIIREAVGGEFGILAMLKVLPIADNRYIEPLLSQYLLPVSSFPVLF
jgi:hypothetical protein